MASPSSQGPSRSRSASAPACARASYSLVDGLVANDRPAGGLDHIHVKFLLGIEAERMRHDDGRCAGDRNEADGKLGFFERAGLREGIGRRRDREKSATAQQTRWRCRRPPASSGVSSHRECGAQHGGFDAPLQAGVAGAFANDAGVVIGAAGTALHAC